MDRKEEIIMATLELASINGLKAVSMSMIANKVGIKKPSLYKHFTSKEEIVNSMYQYLRDKAKDKINIVPIDNKVSFEGKSAYLILKSMVDSYINMTRDSNMLMFYKVIYSERIIVDEKEKIINATIYVFNELEKYKILHFNDLKMSAISFSMTIHGLMDYELDKKYGENEISNINIDDYLNYVCKVNKYEE